MPAYRTLFLLLASLSACDMKIVDNDDAGTGCPTPDANAPADMATPPPKCAAAKGLAGDNLLCVDFKDVQMPSSLAGWDFTCTGGTSWSTTTGKLQINNFSTFMDTCTFKLPPLSAADYAKYSSFTLSVVHRVDISEVASQRVQVMLGADDQSNRLLDWMTGKQPRKQWMQTVAKADLPLAAVGSFQPLFKFSSANSAGGVFSGWQIESIAVNGVP